MQAKKYLSLWIILLGVGLFYSSCEYEFIEPEEVVVPDVVLFSSDIIPIFNNSCNSSGCHDAGFAILDLSPQAAYADLFRKGQIDIDNPENSKLYLKLIDPSGTHNDRSTASERATLLEWIRKGAQNN